GITGQEYSAHSPTVGDSDMMAVDHRSQNLHVLRRDALSAQNFPDRLVAQQFLVVLAGPGRILPTMVAERRRTVNRRPGRVAMKPQAVVGIPLFEHLGVDHDPALGIGTSGVADTQLTPRRRRTSVGGDDK